ncbi:MAG TPA: pentapeptide repeat-containing protein [Bryobacteraceae bacterium]|nr:pentapeptide repeat-containing protein [Bryobacteraceae bacterium]
MRASRAQGALMEGCKFRVADFSESSLHQICVSTSDFSESDFHKTQFLRPHFNGCRFTGARRARANFYKATFKVFGFARSDLTGARFVLAISPEANLTARYFTIVICGMPTSRM